MSGTCGSAGGALRQQHPISEESPTPRYRPGPRRSSPPSTIVYSQITARHALLHQQRRVVRAVQAAARGPPDHRATPPFQCPSSQPTQKTDVSSHARIGPRRHQVLDPQAQDHQGPQAPDRYLRSRQGRCLPPANIYLCRPGTRPTTSRPYPQDVRSGVRRVFEVPDYQGCRGRPFDQ